MWSYLCVMRWYFDHRLPIYWPHQALLRLRGNSKKKKEKTRGGWFEHERLEKNSMERERTTKESQRRTQALRGCLPIAALAIGTSDPTSGSNALRSFRRLSSWDWRYNTSPLSLLFLRRLLKNSTILMSSSVTARKIIASGKGGQTLTHISSAHSSHQVWKSPTKGIRMMETKRET